MNTPPRIKETILNNYPVDYFEKPIIFSSKDVNPEHWKKKIKLKFFIAKRQHLMKKVYELKDQFCASRSLKKKLSTKEFNIWSKRVSYSS